MRSTYFFLLLVCIFSAGIYSCEPASKPVTPESLGFSSDSLQAAEVAMQAYIDSGDFAGISTLVMKQGHIIQRANFGYADMEDQLSMTDSTIFRIFSMTKPITAVALMTLYDEGKFQLDDKVADYIPEFGESKVHVEEDGQHKFVDQEPAMTIRHLLTHTSGISYGWTNSYVDSVYRSTGASGWDGVLADKMKILADLPLNFQPGSSYQYGLSIDVAGYLVEVLSGMPLDEYFQTKIFDPLGMDDSGFYVPEEDHGRFSAVYRFDDDGKLVAAGGRFGDAFKTPVTMFSGGGGLVSTVDDYLTFCRMLVNAGELNGARILTPETAKMIMTNQMPEGLEYEEGKGYGLAGSVQLADGEYSWGGAASTSFWIIPEQELIVMAYAQLMPADFGYANHFKKLVDNAVIQE